MSDNLMNSDMAKAVLKEMHDTVTSTSRMLEVTEELTNRIKRVRKLHKKVDLSSCSEGCCLPFVLCDECNLNYPCNTIKALGGE